MRREEVIQQQEREIALEAAAKAKADNEAQDKQVGKEDAPPKEKNPSPPSNMSRMNATTKPPSFSAQVKVPWFIPMFSRSREVFLGRLAMLGFVGAGALEVALPFHPNIFQQVTILGQLAGLGVQPINTFIGFQLLLLYVSLGSLGPWSATYAEANLIDAEKRPVGPPKVFFNPFTQPKEAFGVTGWGFTKANEVFHGRLAMLGFYFSIVNQQQILGFFGPGPLAQVALLAGFRDADSFYSWVPTVFAGWAILATAVAYAVGKKGSTTGEEEIY